jgi:hypothetical protein
MVHALLANIAIFVTLTKLRLQRVVASKMRVLLGIRYLFQLHKIVVCIS